MLTGFWAARRESTWESTAAALYFRQAHRSAVLSVSASEPQTLVVQCANRQSALALAFSVNRLSALLAGRKSAPRGVHYSNHGFVELGSYALNRLRRKPIIEFHAWNAPPTTENERNDPGKPCRDPLRLARYYQSLLDTGKFESRAALARFLGVSRANVTQALNRLKLCAGINPTSHRPATEIAAG